VIQKRGQRKTRREKKRFKRKTIIALVSLVIILASFFYVMNNDYLAIEEVSIRGQKTLIESDIQQVVDEYLTGTFLGLIRKDNIFILNTSRVEKYLRITFPKIEDITVDIEDGDHLIITIGERSAHSLWCVDREYDSIFDEECYFADRDGLLYARAPYFSGNVYMKLYVQPSEDDTPYIGTTVSAISSFPEFFDFLANLEDRYPIAIERVSFKSFGDVALSLSRVRDVTYRNIKPMIWYNQHDDYETVMRNIGIVLDFEDFSADLTARPEALESIDVRFDGRVFYTFIPIGGRTTQQIDEGVE